MGLVWLCEGLAASKLGVLQPFLCFLLHWQQVPRSPALWPRRRGVWQENKDCVAEFCGLTLLQCFTLFLGFPSSTVCGCHAATCSTACSTACGCHAAIWSSLPEVVAPAWPARPHPACPQPACPHTSTKPHQQQPFFATVALQICWPLLPMWSDLMTVSVQSPSTWLREKLIYNHHNSRKTSNLEVRIH